MNSNISVLPKHNFEQSNWNEWLVFNIYTQIKSKDHKCKLWALNKLYNNYKVINYAKEKERARLRVKYENLKSELFNGSKEIIKEIDSFFWISLLNTSYFYISERDKEILKLLTNISLNFYDENNENSVEMKFEFRKNHYFTNDYIYKKYDFSSYSNAKERDSFIPKIKCIQCSVIKWASDEVNPTMQIIQGLNGSGWVNSMLGQITARNTDEVMETIETNNNSNIVKWEKVKSFFDFFKSYSEGELEKNESLYEKEENMVEYICEDYIPNILYYYLGIVPRH